MRISSAKDHQAARADISASSDWFDKVESALYLKTSPRFFDQLVAQRKIRFYRIGKFIRFNRGDLDAFARDGKVDPLS